LSPFFKGDAAFFLRQGVFIGSYHTPCSPPCQAVDYRLFFDTFGTQGSSISQ